MEMEHCCQNQEEDRLCYHKEQKRQKYTLTMVMGLYLRSLEPERLNPNQAMDFQHLPKTNPLTKSQLPLPTNEEKRESSRRNRLVYNEYGATYINWLVHLREA